MPFICLLFTTTKGVDYFHWPLESTLIPIACKLCHHVSEALKDLCDGKITGRIVPAQSAALTGALFDVLISKPDIGWIELPHGVANREENMIRKILSVTTIGAIGIIASMASASAMDRLTVGTGPAGTLYHQIGTTISTLYQEKTGIQSSAKPFSGTTAYVPLMHRGEVQAGLNGSLESQDAFLGQGKFSQPIDKIRALLMVTRFGFQFFTRADDNIKSISDLKGKNVVTRFRAIQGFDQVIDAILATAGMGEADVNAITVGGVVDGIRSVSEGRTDAAVSALGIPPLRQAGATISGGINILTLGPDEEKVNAIDGLIVKTVKPSPAMVGVSEPVRVLHMNVFLNSSTNVSEEDAYELTKIVHSNWAKVQETLPPLRGHQAKDMVPSGLSHPFHEGAVRYFKEVGLWTDAHQKQQDALLK